VVFRLAWYRQYVFPNLKKLYNLLLESGMKVVFVSDGNYTPPTQMTSWGYGPAAFSWNLWSDKLR
jgi:hypothetical protein